MAIPIRNNEAQDADVVYILGKIKAADDCEAVATSKASDARQFRIEAGLRLIEVRERFVKECGQDRCPHEFAQWYRSNGFEQSQVSRLMTFAGFSEEQREEHKAKERDRKREERAKTRTVGWRALIVERLGVTQGTLDNKNHRALMVEKFGALPKAFKVPSQEADDFVQEYLVKIGLPKDFEREQLPKSAEERVQRAIRVETARLHASYHDEVEKGIKEQLADRITHLEQLREKAAAREKRYELLIAGIKPVISKDDYRFLLNTLHSDRIPSTDKLDKAFIIVKKLEPYIDAS
jgi:hypothetical protein